MAAKTKKKVLKKKPHPTKKTPVKKAAKATARKKVITPTKTAPKPAPRPAPAAPAAAPPVKPSIVPPKFKTPILAKAPVAAVKPAIASKPPKAKKQVVIPADDYRKQRKWTIGKLEPVVADEAGLRKKIGQPQSDATLAAWELMEYLKAVESEGPDWAAKRQPPPDGVPRKRGRPSKADLEARAAGVTPARTLAQATNGIAKAASGQLMPARPVKPLGFKVPKLV